MAGWELAKTGRKVLILEARDRIGGRIYPLLAEDFGFPAQGGAEFTHGPVKITRQLAVEAGVTLEDMGGEWWSVRDGAPTKDLTRLQNKDLLKQRFSELKEDLPISEFLDKYFSASEFDAFRHNVLKMVEGYEAADPKRMSTYVLRDEWLGGDEWEQGRVKEGYGPLLLYLEDQNKKLGTEILLNKDVVEVEHISNSVKVNCADGSSYEAQKLIVTATLPTISRIKFNPTIPEKLEAASKMGFGNVLKVLIRFKDRWWVNTLGQDLSKMVFMLSNEIFGAWWTQYPDQSTVLTGWIAGPKAVEYKNHTEQELLDLALESLSNIFKVDVQTLKQSMVTAKVINWPADPYAQGGYSYSTPETKEAQKELKTPVNNTIFFAGEALYSGKETATVEGALGSGQETANLILNS